jgi:hypothetical protein
MNTARRHPRSTAEAFPRSCEYACPLERPAPRPYPRTLWLVCLVGFIAAIVAARS